jgi:hypothetical protein
MPPRENSRHSFTLGYSDKYETMRTLFLQPRIPFPFRQLSDNRVVVAKAGDTLYALAGKYFAPLTRACGLWWVIADFQPTPIHDPTVALASGRAIVIPSVRTVMEEVFDQERIYESEV